MTAAPEQALDHPLWAFSLQVYGADGVADECLALQERLGLDVNLLLLAAYMGAAEGVTFDAADMADAAGTVAAWHGEIVRALRGARRGLKPASLDARSPLRTAAAGLRAQVKAAELEAEKIEQATLWQWSRARLAGRGRGDPRAALAANLRAVLAHYGADGTAESVAAMQLQAAALACAGPKCWPSAPL